MGQGEVGPVQDLESLCRQTIQSDDLGFPHHRGCEEAGEDDPSEETPRAE